VDKITLQELKEDRPELVEEILKESKTKIDTLSVENEKLKEEKKLHESKDLANEVIKESKLTEVQCGDGLRERMWGKTKEEMQKIIEERKNFLRSFAPPQMITNLSEKAPDTEPEIKPLTETEKAVCKQMNLTEEKFRTLGKGEKLPEKK